jgi:hypothetical protein
MRQLGQVGGVTLLLVALALPVAHAQGMYLSNESNAYMLSASRYSLGHADATAITLGYSIRGRLDLGLGFVKTSADDGAVTVDAVSPSATVHLVRNPAGLPLSLSLSGSAEWQKHSGNLGLEQSDKRTAFGGAVGVTLYDRLSISRAISLVPRCTFSWGDLKVTTDRSWVFGDWTADEGLTLPPSSIHFRIPDLPA